MATSKQCKDFIVRIGNIAEDICRERNYSNVVLWTCISQACLESGYGKSTLMLKANAVFGIKATKNWIKTSKYGGLYYSAKTKECYVDNQYAEINASFRAYLNLTDSVSDYFDLLSSTKYKSCLTADTVNKCINAIKKAGYATDPLYVSKVISIYNRFKKEINAFTVTLVKTDEDVAKEVLQGKWGNGAERRKRL